MRHRWTAAALGAATLLAGCGSASEPAKRAPDAKAEVRAAVAGFYAAARTLDGARLCDTITSGAQRTIERLGRARGAAGAECADGSPWVLATYRRRAKAGEARVRDVRLEGDRATATVTAEPGGLPLLREDGAWKVAPFAVPRVRSRLKVDMACSQTTQDLAAFPLPPIRRAALDTYYRRMSRILRRDARALAAADVTGRPARDQRQLVRELRAIARLLDGVAARVRDGAEVLAATKAGLRQYRRAEATLRRARKGLRANCGRFPFERPEVRRYARTTVQPACRRAERRMDRLGEPGTDPAALARYFDGGATALARLAGTLRRVDPLPALRRHQEQTTGTLKRLARIWREQAAAARRLDAPAYERARAASQPLVLRLGAGLYRIGLRRCL